MPKFTCEFDPVDPAIACKLDAITFAIADLKHDVAVLKQQGENIMSAISDFSDKMTAFFTRQDAAMADLQGDVDNLNAQILALQNSSGTITPADQALLDAIVAKAQTVSDKLDALDSLTPPVVPAPGP